MNLFVRKILISKYLYVIIIIVTILFSFYKHNYPRNLDLNKNNFKGIVTNYSFNGNQLNFVIKEKNVNYKVTYYIKTLNELEKLQGEFKYGIYINVKGSSSIPLNNTIPNTFNYKKYLKSQNIDLIINAESLNIIKKEISIFYKLKNLVVSRITNYKTKDYLLTFIIGDKSLLDNEVLTNYRTNGVTHLFAISGMHIGLFSAIIIFILRILKIKEAKRLIFVTIFLLIYSFLTAFSPSVLRAGIFFFLLSLNKLFYTEISNIKLLITTICILIITNPFIIYNLGFIYSAITSYGLIISSKYLKSDNYLISLLKVSLIAFLFSLPITVQNFYEINLLTVFNNLIFVPLISIIIYPFSLLVFILPFLEPILIILLNITENLAIFLSSLAINLVIPKNNWLVILLYYLMIHLFLINYKYIFIAVILILSPLLLVKFNNNYEVYFLDVNQGDAILIRSPYNQENIMIDVGGKLKFKIDDWAKRKNEFNISDNIITFFKSLGIIKIDCLVGTHGDEDHLGEALNIISKFSLNEVMLNKGKINKLEQNIINTGVKTTSKCESKYLNIKYLETTLANNENDNSIISLVNISNYNFLLMGDASKKQELEIIKKYNLPKIDILKLGHHGSKTSSDEFFLKTINPNYSIISAGRNNRFNHPSKEVLEILNNNNLKYLSTQSHGTIKISVNKELKYSFTKP